MTCTSAGAPRHRFSCRASRPTRHERDSDMFPKNPVTQRKNQNRPSVGCWSVSLMSGESSHFQSNNYTISKRFTVIKNTSAPHFLCVFQQSTIIPAQGRV